MTELSDWLTTLCREADISTLCFGGLAVLSGSAVALLGIADFLGPLMWTTRDQCSRFKAYLVGTGGELPKPVQEALAKLDMPEPSVWQDAYLTSLKEAAEHDDPILMERVLACLCDGVREVAEGKAKEHAKRREFAREVIQVLEKFAR